MKTVADHPSCSGGYFAESCPQLAQQLDDACRGIAAEAVAASRAGIALGSIVLGGGYGRGEGGIWRDSKGASLHNDLDFFLFSDRPDDSQLRAWVAEQEELWTARLGIHVDFGCLPPRALDGARDSMMLTDLLHGYRPVFGAVDFIDVARSRVDATRLPLSEASRLLWNRGSGLFFARCRIAAGEEPEFVERNQQKLALALGDALLCLAGKHHPSVEERGRRLADLLTGDFGGGSSEQVLDLHRRAVAFKLRPGAVEIDWERWQRRDGELTRLWAEVFLRVESTRLGRDFADLGAYTGVRQRLTPETFSLRNLIIAFRDWHRHGACLKPVRDYPRGALMRCLAAIHDGDVKVAAAILQQPAADVFELESSYTDWWQRYQ